LLIYSAWLGRSNIAPHHTDYIFVEMTYQALDHHQSFVAYGYTDGFLKASSSEKILSGGQNVWVDHVSWVSTPFDISSSLREAIYYLPNLLFHARNHIVGRVKSLNELQSLGEVNGVEWYALFGKVRLRKQRSKESG